ncbi:MAG: hypothetical protein KAS72_08460 [Phycisphaerales bacterium]|nr:hypothetical protein [Phycisphaerales bacterium]
MELEATQTMTQFGAAGLIGVLWMWERRLNARRERQLSEAHDHIIEQRYQLEELLKVVADNTRAISSMEACQQRLAALLEGMRSRLDRQPVPTQD